MGKVQRTCRQCGEPFEVYDSPSRAGRGLFCSAGCQRKGRDRSAQTIGSNWRGGRVLRPDGRIDIWIGAEGDPATEVVSGYVLEHRLVMARYLGRRLTRHETVHHIDGVTTDNRIENLQLRIRHGQGQVYVCADCGSDRIAPKEIACEFA